MDQFKKVKQHCWPTSHSPCANRCLLRESGMATYSNSRATIRYWRSHVVLSMYFIYGRVVPEETRTCFWNHVGTLGHPKCDRPPTYLLLGRHRLGRSRDTFHRTGYDTRMGLSHGLARLRSSFCMCDADHACSFVCSCAIAISAECSPS